MARRMSMTEAETTNHQGGEPVVITNRTTIMFRLDWDDEPRETLRMRCLEQSSDVAEGHLGVNTIFMPHACRINLI